MKLEQQDAARRETQYIGQARSLRLLAEFWKDILSILHEDFTQTCTNPQGTQIRVFKDSIIIEGPTSHATLQQLVTCGYATSLNDQGQLQIEINCAGC